MMIYSTYSEVSLKPVIDFAKKFYGKNAYQSSKYFLKWALSNQYIEISTTDAKTGEVYSMIHTMRISTNSLYFKTFFNYISNHEERGAGIKHLASVRREDSFFIPAVSDQGLSKSYERFGADKIHFNWGKRVLIPLPNLPLILKFFLRKNISFVDEKKKVSITNKLCSETVSKISEVSGVADIEFINWRLNSKNNNRVFILEDKEETALIVAVLGKRRHVPVLRVISCFGSGEAVKKLIDRACQLGRELGAIACLATIYEGQSNFFFADRRYKLRLGINTFYKHVNTESNKPLNNFECFMLFGDLGFEEQFGG